MKFQYRSGQRPLAGFTIKRGVGQGTFGEVYYAESDGGKEVALKLLKTQSQSELRGVAHCINLKHPNLIHLYDLRTDDQGFRWVVMEYVFGESLAEHLDRHPRGLSVELARKWFLEIASGVGYLHDQGVVHRDLKPGNALVEEGHIKIGDYGLSRRVSGSQGGDMTRGIGTANYMAPEIKNGNYTRSVDIYACAVILFEMLTGHPPFDGATDQEVLAKHLCDRPDLSRIPPAFVPVLTRGLEKNPDHRFGTMAEFARAVEAIPVTPEADSAPTPAQVIIDVTPRDPNATPWRERLTGLCGSIGTAPVIAALCTLPFAAFAPTPTWPDLIRTFLLATALSWAVLLTARQPRPDDRGGFRRRMHLLFAGMAVGLGAVWLDGWTVPTALGSMSHLSDSLKPAPEGLATAMRYVLYYGLATAAGRWWRLTDRRRREWFRLTPLLGAGIWGLVFLFVWPWEAAFWKLGIAPLVIAALVVQVVSPWSPIPVAVPARPIRVRRSPRRYAEASRLR